jgi:hypothetical protein
MIKPCEGPEFLFDGVSRFIPKSHKLDPNPYTREAIAYFATSLDFDVRLRQAKSKINDGTFREMCRSIHEHPVKAQVRRPDWNIVRPAFIAQVEF